VHPCEAHTQFKRHGKWNRHTYKEDLLVDGVEVEAMAAATAVACWRHVVKSVWVVVSHVCCVCYGGCVCDRVCCVCM